MDYNAAKKAVIEAGKLLLETGLIARTWGNVSCRISDTQFVITPSGRAYDTLTPDDIVAVNIADLSYDGDVKPSSEKGIHADCYRLRPDINFVIHTHQTNASVLSVLSSDIAVKGVELASLIGNKIPIAKYGLPGTKKLRKGVSSAIGKNGTNAVIMAHHGALCMGTDFGEAFKIAVSVESVCAEKLICEAEAAKFKYSGESGNSERTSDGFKMLSTLSLDASPSNAREAQIHRTIYKARPDINHIIHDTDYYTVVCSNDKKGMKPMLDDFAQLIGKSLKTAEDNDKDIAKKVKGRNAVLVNGKGAYCFAASESDTQAVQIVLNKGCKTQTEATLLGKPKSLGAIDCLLMRVIYLKKYSKQI